jgi:hypothetical protein
MQFALKGDAALNRLPMPLYHGTSTLFLKGILESGLGGQNPIESWGIFNFVEELWPLVEKHLAKEDEFMLRADSFSRMVNQTSAAMNFQHGDTYLSPSQMTAARYASNQPYGSEILSYALELLEELVRRKVDGVADELYQRHPQIFNFMDISPAPLIIEVVNCPVEWLVTENGENAGDQLEQILEFWNSDKQMLEIIGQQTNFRLTDPVGADGLKIWLLNVLQWRSFNPEYQKFLLDLSEVPGGRSVSCKSSS